MSRRVYISCDSTEQKLPEIDNLVVFLIKSKCIIEYAPNHWRVWDYRLIEEAIERCDSFVAGVGLSSSCSTWLAHEFTYAHSLRQQRMRKRPRIFAVRLSNSSEPAFFERSPETYPVEWITEENHQLILEDLPEQY